MLVELKNTTRKLCVIGDPVLHSKSPLIHNTMLAALGLDYVYLCQPVPRRGDGRPGSPPPSRPDTPGSTPPCPTRRPLSPLMDDFDPDARLYGAVNTVCLREGRAIGYNTDGLGFLRALADAGVGRRGRRWSSWGPGGRPGPWP